MRFFLIVFFVFSILRVNAADLLEAGNISVAPSIDCDDYWYVSGGVLVMAPKISLGYRFQRGNFGGDISFMEAALPPSFFNQGMQFNQLYYPRPNLKGEWYIGLSEGIYCMFGHVIGTPFWETSIGVLGGYQFRPKKRRHFIEGKIGIPLILSVVGAKFPVPVPSISYGVSF